MYLEDDKWLWAVRSDCLETCMDQFYLNENTWLLLEYFLLDWFRIRTVGSFYIGQWCSNTSFLCGFSRADCCEKNQSCLHKLKPFPTILIYVFEYSIRSYANCIFAAYSLGFPFSTKAFCSLWWFLLELHRQVDRLFHHLNSFSSPIVFAWPTVHFFRLYAELHQVVCHTCVVLPLT